MKVLLCFYILFSSLLVKAQEKNLLSGKYSKESLKTVLIPAAQWAPFPKLNDRTGWAKANEKMMQAYLKQAEQYLNYSWPSIPATKSLLIDCRMIC